MENRLSSSERILTAARSQYRAIAYQRYEESWTPPVYSAYYQRKLKDIRILPGSRCLDLGCGFGNFMHFYRSKGAEAFGVDGSVAGITHVKKEFGPDRGECGDLLEYLRTKSQSWDVISAIDVVEHFDKGELAHLLLLISQKLNRGGLLIIRMPNPSGIYGMRAMANDITHETFLTWEALADFSSRFGFRSKMVLEDGPCMGSPLQSAQFLLWKVLSWPFRILQFVEDGMITPSILTKNYWWIGEYTG